MPRILFVVSLLAAAAVTQAAPAPLPKPDRKGPSVEQLVALLKEQGIEVTRIQQTGPGNWAIVSSRNITVRTGLLNNRFGVQQRKVETVQYVTGAKDERAALRSLLERKQEVTRVKY